MHFIRRGQAASLTLAQIRTILEIRAAGDAPCGRVERLLADRLYDIGRQLTELRRLRVAVAVADLHRAATQAEPDSCAPETICCYL